MGTVLQQVASIALAISFLMSGVGQSVTMDMSRAKSLAALTNTGACSLKNRLKEYGESAQEEKTEITCHHCSHNFKKSEYGIQHVKTIEGRTIEYLFCPACKQHMVALVE